MFNGELYRRINTVQRRLAKQVIQEFSPRLKFRPDGRDSLLDIGCGTGDVTADYILPVLPQQFARLVGADISESMLSVARQTLNNPKVEFERLDIGSPIVDPSVWSTLFDHVTSFFCLHYVNDRQAFQNIYDLLKPGGDCLLAYLCSHPHYNVLHRMSRGPRWSAYRSDIDKSIPFNQFSIDPIDGLERIMSDIGFSQCTVEVRDANAEYEGFNDLKCNCSNRIAHNVV